MSAPRGHRARVRPRVGVDLDGLALLGAELVRHRAAGAADAARATGAGGARRSSPTGRRGGIAAVAAPVLPESTPLPVAAVPAQGRTRRAVEAEPTASAPTPPPRGVHTPYVPTEEVADLVARAQQGDAEAFGALYDRYVEVVYRYVYYRVGSAALAEDLVSETFLRALRRISSFSWQGRDVAAWFITIARNLIADHYKSSRYRLEVSTEDMLGASGHRVSGEDPEQAVLAGLDNRVLIEAIKRLGAEQQECVVLRFLQGLSVSETAEAMGKNDGSIKALQYRAVRALARQLPAGFAP